MYRVVPGLRFFTRSKVNQPDTVSASPQEEIEGRLTRIEAALVRIEHALVSARQVQSNIPRETLLPGSGAGKRPVVEIAAKGNLANRMIQFMAALSLADHVPGCIVTGVHLPEWDIDIAATPCDDERVTTVDGQHVPIGRLSSLLKQGLVDKVVLDGYCQHFDNFLPVARYREIFQIQANVGRTFGPDCLVINIRGGEILHAPHESYVLIPVSFYVDIVAKTELRPVFMGELTPSPYLDALRAAFPDAEYVASGGAAADFATICKAANIVISISTFSWLAAWLSNAQTVIMPLSGLMNPLQCADVDFLPKDDVRYSFYIFPVNYAVPVERYLEAHRALDGTWRSVSYQEVADLRALQPSKPRLLEDYLKVFDEDYYLSFWGDVANAVKAGVITSGKHHFEGVGFRENRQAFALEKTSYIRLYPEAADAISRGLYLDLWHYHASVGRHTHGVPT